MASFNINPYYNYRSSASLFRAMCVGIGGYKLYFSFGHLICVRIGDNQHITKEKFNYTGKHKDFLKNIRHYYGESFEVEQNELELMLFRDLLKLPSVGRINIYSYCGYRSDASKYKAMCVELGEFKLYYSYYTLIAFEITKNQYITSESYSHTTNSHKYSARNYRKDVQYVEQNVLELITLTSLLKLPFEEARDIAEFSCERVYLP